MYRESLEVVGEVFGQCLKQRLGMRHEVCGHALHLSHGRATQELVLEVQTPVSSG